jgi:aryl-alcohol dehydrogenase-like predicted oxidoreductase
MKYRLFGNSGLRVAEMALGTMTFGEDWGWGSGKDEARQIYDAYRAAGGNFIDTANIYTNGTSEDMLGEFTHGHRHEMVLATKYTNAAPGKDANAGGNHRKSMVQAVEASLRRLRTDYIDLYWLHIWDRMTPVEEVMRAFDDLVRAGKVLYIGVSDTPAWWIAQANTIADLRGWTQFAGLQIEYSLVERTVERELTPMAKAFKLGMVAWSPLGGGLLSGKYQAGQAPSGQASGEANQGRLSAEAMQPFLRGGERVERVVATLKKISDQTGRSLAQAALAWLRYREIPVIPIVGARKLSQLQDNLGSLTLELNQEQVTQLNQASAIELGFPHDFYEIDMVKGLLYGGMREQIMDAA